MIISFTLQQDSSLLGILWDTYCIWELHEGRTNTFQFGVCTKHFTLYTSWDIEHLPWSLLRSSLLQQDCHYCFRLQFFHFSQMLADLVTLWMMLPVRWNRIHFSAFMIPLWQMHWGLLHCVHCAEKLLSSSWYLPDLKVARNCPTDTIIIIYYWVHIGIQLELGQEF